MARLDFYHLYRWPLDRALPKLLLRVWRSGAPAVVLAGSMERVRGFNSLLWTFDPNVWLPHGCAEDGHAEDQPIWLTDREERPNGARLAVLTDGMAVADPADWDRLLELFDGHDDAAVEAARGRWRAAREAGHALYYWQQTEQGGWVEKARANVPDAETLHTPGES